MIVKNEAAIIERALASLLPIVSNYVILDTGSSDNTVELIKSYFDAAGVLGEIHSGQFENFGQARNDALALCHASKLAYDYILLTDADMQLSVVDVGELSGLTAAAYLVRQRNAISYFNVRLLRRDVAARYVGVTHEYVDLAGHAAEPLTAIEFSDFADGANRPQKAARDIALLSAYLETHPQDARAMFYLAQSYRDAGQLADAVAAYGQRLSIGGWEEEAWYAQYQLALCQRDLGNRPGFVATCLEAFQRRPWRAEPLYSLAKHYREQGAQTTALLFAETAAAIAPPKQDVLFIEDFVYETGCREELAISGYYGTGPEQRRKGAEACNSLALDRKTPEMHRNMARNNLLFYALTASELFGNCSLVALDIDTEAPWATMNPSIASDGHGNLHLIVRGVNYRIGSDGRYSVHDPAGIVRTQNYCGELDATLQPSSIRLAPDRSARNLQSDATICGYEDCRLIRWRNRWWASATVRDQDPQMRAQMVLLEFGDDGSICAARTLCGYGTQEHEKNWMPCVRGDDLLFVYSCDPLIVLRILQLDDHLAHLELANQSVPIIAAGHLRGGSQLLPFDNGWLTITHEVVYAGSSRHYLHRMIWIDESFRLRRITMPFFLKHEGVEFVAGLATVPGRDAVIISFGVRDAEAALAEISFAGIRSALRGV